MVVPCSFTYTLYLIGGSRGPSASSPFRGLIKNRDFWNSITIIGALVDGSSETLPDEWGSKIGRLPATNDSRSLRDLLYCCKWTGRRKQPINGTNTFLFIARRPCLALSVTAIHCSLFLSLSLLLWLARHSARGRFALFALFSAIFPRCSLFLIAFLPYVHYPVSPRLIPTLVFSIHAIATRRCLDLASSRKITALHACTRLLTFVPAFATTIYKRSSFTGKRIVLLCIAFVDRCILVIILQLNYVLLFKAKEFYRCGSTYSYIVYRRRFDPKIVIACCRVLSKS